ncbi:MAG: hypothetical protein ONB30_10280 [candidate division KSB1 bacterium]|nr:hypothetical protein [candidate division KSB1 bacterium]
MAALLAIPVALLAYSDQGAQDWSAPEVLLEWPRPFSALAAGVDWSNTVYLVWPNLVTDQHSHLLHYYRTGVRGLPEPVTFTWDSTRSLVIFAGSEPTFGKDFAPHVIWQDCPRGRLLGASEIYYSTLRDDRWTPPVPLVRGVGEDAIAGRVLPLPGGRLVAYWFTMWPRALWFSLYADGQWSQPFVSFPSLSHGVGQESGGIGYADVALRSQDSTICTVLIGWTETDLRQNRHPVYYAEQTISHLGRTVPPIRVVHVAHHALHHPKLALAQDGSRYVFWAVAESKLDPWLWGLYYCFSVDGSRWSAPRRIFPRVSFSLVARWAEVDPSGVVHVVIDEPLNGAAHYVSVYHDELSEAVALPWYGNGCLALFIDHNNREHLFWGEPSPEDSTQWLLKHVWRQLSPSSARPVGEQPIGRWLKVSVHPNPSNGAFRLVVEAEPPAPVEVVIYDVVGRQIARVAQEAIQSTRSLLVWNGVDASGLPVPSGVYWCVARTVSPDGARVARQKLVLLR